MINWNLIEEGLPDLGTFTILTNDDKGGFKDNELGMLVPSTDGSTAAFLVGKKQVISPSKWKYWAPLYVTDLEIPDTVNQDELIKYYDHCKAVLDSYEARFIVATKASMSVSNNMYAMDQYISGIITRSLSLIYGTVTLLDSKNFMAAAHLTRLHLDNYLRLFAAYISPNPNDFAMQVMDGVQVDKLLDRDKKPMKDWYLREKASKINPWVNDVYKETSGYIHFSRKHIFSATQVSKTESMVIQTYLSKYDHENVTMSNRIEAVFGMVEISNCILQYIEGWIMWKMNNDKIN